jgi:hypothetical protein
MDIPGKHDWFNINAIVPPLAVLFTNMLGLFTRSAMSQKAEILWILATFIMAFLVWLNAAKTQQHAREDREHARENREKLDKIIQLLPKPGTTLEDITRVINVGVRVSAGSSMRVETIASKADDEEEGTK